MEDDPLGDRRPMRPLVVSSLVSHLNAFREDHQRLGCDHPTRDA
ncbi:hypothetical protein [Natrinema sp. SYSU A 869]|nr:hypothetical protein [Natrinema sp. SYSU A 869]